MANKIFGEARLNLQDGRELTLRFDFGALVEAEEAANKDTKTMMVEMARGSPRLGTARAMLYGGLRFHHSDVTLEEAGDIIMEDGEAASQAMSTAMSEMADRKAAANPQKGATATATRTPPGTGTRSSKSGAKRA